MRGGGNFSVRFFETLAMGRIPILINTDCRLPFHQIIDWKSHCLIVNENEVKDLSQKILEFHNQFTNKELIKMQQSNRLLWEKYFTKEGFFLNFEKELQKHNK
jgi:hypothetical protein